MNSQNILALVNADVKDVWIHQHQFSNIFTNWIDLRRPVSSFNDETLLKYVNLILLKKLILTFTDKCSLLYRNQSHLLGVL